MPDRDPTPPAAVPNADSDVIATVPGAGDLLPAPRAGTELDRPAAPSEPSPYAPRFHFLYGVLLALVIAAAGVAVVVAVRPAAPSRPPWSSWRPSTHGPAGAQQIADHVSPEYRLPDGKQLVTVRGGPLQFQSLDASIVVKSAGASSADSLVSGSSVLYVLSGDGTNAAISYGKPSLARGLLLRREALELALYSFRYINDIENVVAILPPQPHAKQTEAIVVLLQRQDLVPALAQPLTDTLAAAPPALTALGSGPDLAMVNAVTRARLFHYGLQQTQDLKVQLELTPA